MATADLDAWMEEALVTITEQGGSDIEYAAFTENIDPSPGAKDIEGIPLVNGGRVTRYVPEEDTEISLEMYPLEASSPGPWGLQHGADGTEPELVSASRTRNKHRLAILWTEDATVTSAADQPGTASAGLRISYAEGYFTNVDYEFTGDKIMKVTATFKVVPFDKDGDANYQIESQEGDGANQITALSAYTSSNKF